MRKKDHDDRKHHHTPLIPAVEQDETATDRMNRADNLDGDMPPAPGDAVSEAIEDSVR